MTVASTLTQSAPAGEATAALSVDELHMDLDGWQVWLAGRSIELTYQEFLLLKAFMRNPRRVLSRQQLIDQAWDYTGRSAGRTVDVHVRRLRMKLGSEAPQIVTQRSVGYRLDPARPDRRP